MTPKFKEVQIDSITYVALFRSAPGSRVAWLTAIHVPAINELAASHRPPRSAKRSSNPNHAADKSEVVQMARHVIIVKHLASMQLRITGSTLLRSDRLLITFHGVEEMLCAVKMGNIGRGICSERMLSELKHTVP